SGQRLNSGRFSQAYFFFQAEDGIRDFHVTGVQTCALPISSPITREQDLRRFAQEVRFSSTFQGPVQLLVGGFYSDSTRPRDYEWTAPGASPAFASTDLLLSFIESRNANEYALFGDVSYQALPSLKATVGMRCCRDTATFHQVTDGFFFGGAQSIYDGPTGSEG